MRILHYLHFPEGGITRYCGEVLRAMSPEIERHIICPPATQISVPCAAIHHDLVSLRRGGLMRRRLFFLCSQFQNPRRLITRANLLQPDIIHFGDINHLTYFDWGTRLKALRIPFVVSVHDVTRQKPLLNRQWENQQLVKTYRDAAMLFVHSRAQQLQLSAFAAIDPNSITLVPHGVYNYPTGEHPTNVRQELGIPLGAHTGLFFGDIRDDKGLEKLIAAVATLPDTHLVVAGQSRSRKQKPITHYRQLSQVLKAQSRIHFVESFIPEERVADYFRAADWCGLSYDKGFTSQSAVLCSAINFKTPVLVASAPTLLETVAKYRIGIAATDDSVESLTVAMRKLRARDGPTAFEFEKYTRECSWKRNAEITCVAYQNILALKN